MPKYLITGEHLKKRYSNDPAVVADAVIEHRTSKQHFDADAALLRLESLLHENKKEVNAALVKAACRAYSRRRGMPTPPIDLVSLMNALEEVSQATVVSSRMFGDGALSVLPRL
jgi:hypothetical protein